jgi:hypothetical protein
MIQIRQGKIEDFTEFVKEGVEETTEGKPKFHLFLKKL